MPPSGYSQSQANSIANFLISCANALHEEATLAGETLSHALDRELSDIGTHLGAGRVEQVQAATLRLTEAFYQKVRAKSPKNSAEYWEGVAGAAASVEEEILGVKI